MDKNSKVSEENFIQNIMKLFGEPDQNELKKDIEKAKKLQSKTKSINEFLKKYANSQIDIHTSQQMIYDIISKLITFRKDFLLLMQIYITSIDEIKSEALRNHFILEEKTMKKIENGDKNGEAFIQFGVSFSCLFDEDSYYKKFVQGILLYLRAAFKEKYLSEYIENDFYKFLDKSKYYKENTLSLIYSLNNMLVDINRVISENSQKEINKYSEKDENKMTNQKFGVFSVQCSIHKYKEYNEVKSIYEKSKNNDEILKEINKLLESNTNGLEDEFYGHLLLFKDKIEQFIESEKKKVEIEKIIAENNSQLYYSRKQIRDLEKVNSEFHGIKEEFGKNKNDNNNLLKKVGLLEKKNGELESKIKNLQLKVDFMEPIVLSLISRKVINYSIIKILQNYKKYIKVSSLNQNNVTRYIISFKDPLGKIGINELNNLIDNLFNKKDEFNKDSHLVNKNVPSFIPNIWEQVKQHLKLNKDEIIVFDSLITDDIKSGFKLGEEDISVKNYLETVGIKEFGK